MIGFILKIAEREGKEKMRERRMEKGRGSGKGKKGRRDGRKKEGKKKKIGEIIYSHYNESEGRKIQTPISQII